MLNYKMNSFVKQRSKLISVLGNLFKSDDMQQFHVLPLGGVGAHAICRKAASWYQNNRRERTTNLQPCYETYAKYKLFYGFDWKQIKQANSATLPFWTLINENMKSYLQGSHFLCFMGHFLSIFFLHHSSLSCCRIMWMTF